MVEDKLPTHEESENFKPHEKFEENSPSPFGTIAKKDRTQTRITVKLGIMRSRNVVLHLKHS